MTVIHKTKSWYNLTHWEKPMKRKPKKQRKPITMKATPDDAGHFSVGTTRIIVPYELYNLKPRQARKLANWLIRAADYLDGK